MPQIKNNRFFKWFEEQQSKHWVISLIVVRLSVLWYSLILSYLGEKLGLVSLDQSNRSLTVWGWLITALLTVLAFVSEVSKRYEDLRRVNPPEVAGYALLNTIKTSIDSVCISKYNTLVDKIHSVKTERTESPPNIISNPQKQLEGIAKEMVQCLYYLLQDDTTRWNNRDLYISIAYQFPLESDDWHWATEEHGLCFDELLAKSKRKQNISTFQYLLRNRSTIAFFNSKERAMAEGHYIPDDFDERDSKGHLLGSIACYKGTIKKEDKTYIRYIVTLASYSKPFTTKNDVVNNLRYNMKNEVFSEFAIRISIELCLLYLKHLRYNDDLLTDSQELAENA